MKNIIEKAYAKINLGLQVLNKRPDGFHNINTVFTRINLFDELIFSYNEKFEIRCNITFVFPVEQNIIYKAAMLFKEYFNLKNINVKITLKKNIPMGAGLGGGSSDAASTLIGLSKFLDIQTEYNDLVKISCELGSDVLYFLKDGTAIGKGKGEILNYFDYSIPFKILVLYPRINISTAEAYQKLNRTGDSSEMTNFEKVLIESKENHYLLKKYIYNDFETVVFQQYPEIADVKQKLYSYGAVFSLLSGSGSSVYGFFENTNDVISAQGLLNEYQTFIC